jgi:hypothetical protein
LKFGAAAAMAPVAVAVNNQDNPVAQDRLEEKQLL